MRREYFWALVTLIIAIVLAYLLLTIVKDAESQYELAAVATMAVPLPKCVDNETRDMLKRQTDRAVEQAYQHHVGRLFDVWMGNPNTEQFNRARVGMQNGIKGYLIAHEYADAWIPAPC